jgi:hypothetical protein
MEHHYAWTGADLVNIERATVVEPCEPFIGIGRIGVAVRCARREDDRREAEERRSETSEEACRHDTVRVKKW